MNGTVTTNTSRITLRQMHLTFLVLLRPGISRIIEDHMSRNLTPFGSLSGNAQHGHTRKCGHSGPLSRYTRLGCPRLFAVFLASG